LSPMVERHIDSAPVKLELEAKFQSGGLHVERFDAKIANGQINAKFKIDHLNDIVNSNGEIQITGASSKKLANLLGLDETLPDEAYTLSVNIRNSDDRLELSPISLTWGTSDLRGNLTFQPGNKTIINANLQSKFISLPFLLPDTNEFEQASAIDNQSVQPADAPDALTQAELEERIIPTEELNFDWLNNLDATVKYQIDEIYLGEGNQSSAAIDIRIADSMLSLRKLHLDGTLFVGDATMSIRALDSTNEFEVLLNMQRVPLFLMIGGKPEYDVDSFYRARIQSSGSTLRQMAQNANGLLAFKGSGGTLHNPGLGLVLGDTVGEIFSTLNPYSVSEDRTRVHCSAGAMNITDGLVNVAPGIVLRTDKMDITAGGTINLHDEKLSLVFNTQSRKGMGISASKAITPYFKVGGTLANPLPALDVRGAAVSGGAAIATAGMSILAEGLWDRWIATAVNPCESLFNKASKQDKEIYQSLLN
jgi:uncharacterized protein involved in outer membrane biogenesis